MKRTYSLALPAIILFVIAGAVLSAATAQTTTPARERQATPTPTPRAAPTINEEDQIVKIDTELVNLNVRVVDRNNRPISNLRQNEFKIFEDGVAQQIEFFSKSEVPTNYSLVIDSSGSLRYQIDQVIEAGKILVGANKPEDETSIIRFVSSDKIEVIENFSPNKADLIEALDTKIYVEGGQTAIIDAVYLAADQISKYEKATSATDRKRRALILVSDGEDRSSFYTKQQLFEFLRETDVQIYVIGFVKELSDDKGFITKSAQGKAKAFLEKMATETGGKSYFPKDVSELNGIAREIASELRTQYSIGYVPSNDRLDGTYRQIKVLVDDGLNKQKRIALTRAGRTSEANGGAAAPTVQKP